LSEEGKMAKAYDAKVAKAQARLAAAYKAADEHQRIQDFRTPGYNHERALLEIFNEAPRRELDTARKALARAQAAPRTPAERDAQNAAKAAAKAAAQAAREQRAAERAAKAAERAAKAASIQASRPTSVKKPGTAAKRWQTKLTPVGHVPDRLLDPYGPPNADALAKLYGREQLRTALERYKRNDLVGSAAIIARHYPAEKPLSASASRQKLIDYLVSHADAARIPNE
jgi:hypothetical protein